MICKVYDGKASKETAGKSFSLVEMSQHGEGGKEKPMQNEKSGWVEIERMQVRSKSFKEKWKGMEAKTVIYIYFQIWDNNISAVSKKRAWA